MLSRVFAASRLELGVTMPRTPPPEASAARVRELYLASTQTRRAMIAADEALYRAAYQANLEGWSGRALGKAIGVHYRTADEWIAKGRLLTEPC